MMIRIERVRTDAGWHGRILAANGEPIWTTEVLEDSRGVQNAVLLVVQMVAEIKATPDVRHMEDIDERNAQQTN